jgi:hypothetical protein
MKKLTIPLLLIALLFACAGKTIEDIPNGNKKDKEESGGDGGKKELLYKWEKERTSLLDYHNMVLIYSGGSHRKYKWDEETIQPYVTYTDESGTEHWLFDSFLFLEIHDGAGKMFAKGYTSQPANQRDWKNLVDHYFESRTCLGALNRVVGAAIKRIGEPGTKRRVVIGLPEPISDLKDWGTVSDRVMLDFSNTTHRLEACKWYIDYVRSRFNEMNYMNLELAGFYWIAEHAADTRSIMKEIGAYLNELNYTFNWIPYFKSYGYSEWKAFGFNYAYLQPNYFFQETIPYSRLTDACYLAIAYGMDMEMEFDERALTGWGYRLKDYMKAFKENGIWQNKRLAYYQGGTALYQLAQTRDPELKELYHQFCKFVVESVQH